MRRYSGWITVGLALVLLGGRVIAAALAACPEQVAAALQQVDSVCSATARNQACYGYPLLEAEPQPNVVDFAFDAPGHTVDVAALRALRLLPIAEQAWGVALLRLQANLPDSSSENVTMLLFGDAQIENAALPATETEVTVPGPRSANVRLTASTRAGVIGTVRPGQTVTAVERVADSSWVRVRMPDTGELGWVSAALVSGDISMLNVADSADPHYAPMQAFYFRSGTRSDACQEAANGLLIQTPEGVGQVRLWMNEVRLHIGSTVFFQATPGGYLVVQTLEGSALVEANGIQQTAVAGTQVRVALDANGHAISAPTVPEPYDGADARVLPTRALDREIVAAEPLTTMEITRMLAPLTAVPQVNSGGNNGRGAGRGGSDNDPGNGRGRGRGRGGGNGRGGDNDDDD
jgi:hypothetical protein